MCPRGPGSGSSLRQASRCTHGFVHWWSLPNSFVNIGFSWFYGTKSTLHSCRSGYTLDANTGKCNRVDWLLLPSYVLFGFVGTPRIVLPIFNCNRVKYQIRYLRPLKCLNWSVVPCLVFHCDSDSLLAYRTHQWQTACPSCCIHCTWKNRYGNAC